MNISACYLEACPLAFLSCSPLKLKGDLAWGFLPEVGLWMMCAVPGSVILKHLLTGKGLWEQTWDWQVGFNSKDFVQLPKNHNPDAGAEHMLLDRNDVLGKRRHQQVSVRHWSESSTALPCPFHSTVCASVTGWAGGVLHLLLCCTQKEPHQRQIPYLLFSLSLFLLCMSFSELLIRLTHSFWRVHFYCCSSETTIFPRHWYSLLFSLSLLCWRSVPSLKAPARRQQACMHWNKEKHSPRLVIFYPFTATLIRR